MPKLTKKRKSYCCVADMVLSINKRFPEEILRRLYKKRKKRVRNGQTYSKSGVGRIG
jgi:hypothetical protein